MTFYAAFTLFSGSRTGLIDCKLVTPVKMDLEQQFYLLKRIGHRGKWELGSRATANCEGDWFRFQRRPPASTPDTTGDDCTGDCTWAGMTTKQRKTLTFWNSYARFRRRTSAAKSNSTIGRPKFVNPGWIDSNAELYSGEINWWKKMFKIVFFKLKRVSKEQQILSTLFIIRPVSSDHTNFIGDLTRFTDELIRRLQCKSRLNWGVNSKNTHQLEMLRKSSITN